MNPQIIIAVIVIYFLLLMGISYFTGKNSTNFSFFLGEKNSKWYLVAFGMIGASLSGVTFISVPGWVNSSSFSYMQVVLGYFAGYLVIAFVLLPLYYRLNLTSIYTYLNQRFGIQAYKTGAFYFLISRMLGSAFRLYLVATVLQLFVFNEYGVPFELTVFISIAFIWLYTFKGGIKTIIITDTFQTLFMLLAVFFSIYAIKDGLGLSFSEMTGLIGLSEKSQWLFWDDFGSNKQHFIKQFIGGMFITITMTGLDQDMMQKNLSCKNIGEAKKNMLTFSTILIVVNLLFLSLGLLLHEYAAVSSIEIPQKSDALFPTLALEGGLGIAVGIFFILGLVAAAYSSADSALTAMTTSVCVDFLDIEIKTEKKQVRLRKLTHVLISVVLALVIIVFNQISESSVIDEVLTVAGYTYGPLLGLFAFGILTKFSVKGKWVIPICILSPLLTHGFKMMMIHYGYEFSYELLLVNGLLTFLGLLLIKR
jgi:solute:Na+ symporter, SSS family